eukprot:TRINITY_DN3249_c0_g1_i6.p2 TRINITY_DN3249_c0_g1~~TRINITY_DN3249_c0_g1_i6.p2  ORF type:complete len:154 (+),score=21.88 TRINITY_DN3249_c0_g1_i6:297-758(+)
MYMYMEQFSIQIFSTKIMQCLVAACSSYFLFTVFVVDCQDVDLNKLLLPPGFSIQFYIDGKIPDARSLALGGKTRNGGTIVYLSTRKQSFVYALIDDDADGFAERKVVVIDNQNNPFGLAYKNGSLWVAQRDTRILRLTFFLAGNLRKSRGGV